MKLGFVLLFSVAITSTNASFGGCDNGITCANISANGLTFHCRFAGSGDAGHVMLLHGFPEFSSMYMPLMRKLSDSGLKSVACNQRGYSPEARPEGVENYAYHVLASDVFAIADELGLQQFHLVAHDHGAVLGWTIAASDLAKRLLSFTSLSIPHDDAFARGLFGPDADVDQQVASQYFSMFLMNNSASIDVDAMYYTMGKTAGDKYSDEFNSAADFQKALYWYNGAFADGVLSLPPLFSASDLLWKYGNPAMAALREIYTGCDANKQSPEGIPQTKPIGNVSTPVLFICGSSDSAIKCAKGFSLKTQDYCTGRYTYLKVDCGHDVLSKGITDGCSSDAEVTKVYDAIQSHILA